LKAFKIAKIAPSHCTGKEAINIFREEWGTQMIDFNLGDEQNI
jgi:metal-dependent hydrolase (beta-lactamase superfamily II)